MPSCACTSVTSTPRPRSTAPAMGSPASRRLARGSPGTTRCQATPRRPAMGPRPVKPADPLAAAGVVKRAGGSAGRVAVARSDRLLAGRRPQHLVAAWAYAHERHRRPAVLGDEVQVLARAARQVGEAPALADVLVPALELGVLGARVVQHRLV